MRGPRRTSRFAMSHLPDHHARYSEDEVALILRRAAELQTRPPGGEAADGLTLATLEEIAREAGLDPMLVRRAAAEVEDRRAAVPVHRALGAPARAIVERRLAVEPTRHAYEVLVAELRRTFGTPGETSSLGRTVAWSSAHPGIRQITVTVVPRESGTVLRVDESFAPLAGGLFGGIVGGLGGGGLGAALGVGLGVFASPARAVGGAAAFVIGSYALARRLFGDVSGKRAIELRELADRLADVLISESGSAPSPPLAPEVSG